MKKASKPLVRTNSLFEPTQIDGIEIFQPEEEPEENDEIDE